MMNDSEKAPIVSLASESSFHPNDKKSQQTQLETPNPSLFKRLLSQLRSPFPKSLGKSCLQAAKILETYLDQSQEQSIISQKDLDNCKGIAIISVIKGAYMWSGRIGSGLVVARKEDGSWSAPWAIQTFGVGYGFQAGLEVTDMVVILRDQDALNALTQKGNVTLGGNLTVALGPYGRSAEIDVPVTCALMYSLSKSRGVFAGVSLELSVWLQAGRNTNKFYGKRVTIADLMTTVVDLPEEVRILHQALNLKFPSQIPLQSLSGSAGVPDFETSPPYQANPDFQEKKGLIEKQ